jgi:Cytochrome oxidase complex assembly protein 1
MDDNTSGQGARAQVPAEIDRWNWGAFLLNWIWGLGNETYIALLMFVPGVNVVMMFVLGAKGSAWAWRNTRWRDVAHFRRVQRLWAIWGVVAWAASIGLVVAMIVSFLWLFSHTQAYTMAVERLTQSPAAIADLGSPITAGFPSGHVSVKDDSGSAELSFSATGPKGSGTVYADARKDLGVWRLIRLELAIDGRDRRIDLGATPRRSGPLLPLE